MWIVQEPSRARACGLRSKDRRFLSPIPVVQIRQNTSTNGLVDVESEVLLLVSLKRKAKPATREYTKTQGIAEVDGLVGNCAVAPSRYTVDGRQQDFFVMHDLSVRKQGQFTLLFTLIDLNSHPTIPIMSLESCPFGAFAPKDYPGSLGTTPLVQSFHQQGLLVKIRK